MIDDLKSIYSEGRGGRGTLDFLRIVSDPAQTAAEYRRMLSEVRAEYMEFSRPPYAVDPLDEKLVKQARLSRRLLPAAAGSRHTGRRAPAKIGGLRGRRRRGAAGGFSAHEVGRIRRTSRHDRIARPCDHQAKLDRGGVRPRRHGRGHDRPVRGPLANREGPVKQERKQETEDRRQKPRNAGVVAIAILTS